jgi:regulator of sirC expression with transglutaminase-like and TPR domain
MENKATEELSITPLSKHKLLELLDALVLEADKRLEQSFENDEQVRDIVGKIHHLTRSLDVDSFTKPSDDRRPLDSKRRCYG